MCCFGKFGVMHLSTYLDNKSFTIDVLKNDAYKYIFDCRIKLAE